MSMLHTTFIYKSMEQDRIGSCIDKVGGGAFRDFFILDYDLGTQLRPLGSFGRGFVTPAKSSNAHTPYHYHVSIARQFRSHPTPFRSESRSDVTYVEFDR